MDPLQLLPATPLAPGRRIGDAFLERGCADFRGAARLVWTTPYGRNERTDDPLCVLIEHRGTCSTKHALLARLAIESGIPGIALHLGIYEMSEANTPGVGATLQGHGLGSVLEAHCFLVVEGAVVDLTRSGVQPGEPLQLLHEERIEADDIGETKRAFHRRYLAAAIAAGSYAPRTLDDVWSIREECIAALAEVQPSQSAHSGLRGR